MNSQEADLYDVKKRKERFLLFIRVLMKYVEKKDHELYLKIKRIIWECAMKVKNQVPGYENATASMKLRLEEVVSVKYWKRANQYLAHFLALKQKKLTV